jgi:hypothetical protein
MDSRFWIAFGNWQIIAFDICLLLGIYFFIKLPKEKKANRCYWLPFLILGHFVLYQNFGAYTNYNFEFKKAVNAYLGNTENPKFNLWLFNITERQILTVLYLFLIKSWLDPFRKKYINWMIAMFVILALILQISGIELMYSEQPIIFAIGANMILIACGLYFIQLITDEKYLVSNPLRILSFWTTTFLLFNYSLTYVSSVSLLYLYRVNPDLGKSLSQIGQGMDIINVAVLVLLIGSPFLTKLFDREPLYEYSR